MDTIDLIRVWLTANWFGVLGFVVGVLSLLATFVVYRWQIREKRPVYAMRHVSIVRKTKETFPSLQIHYRGHGDDLENLTATIIAIWNAGRETVHGSDIAEARPLVIKATGEMKILGASIVQTNNVPSQAACAYNKPNNQATLTFDYLDCGHGFVVEVLHTGVERHQLVIEGTFKGCGELAEHTRRAWRARLRFLHKTASFRMVMKGMLLCMWLVMVLTGFLFMYLESTVPSYPVLVIEDANFMKVPGSYMIVEKDGLKYAIRDNRWFVTIAVFGFDFFFTVYTWLFWKLFSQKVPRGLDQYEERLSE